MSAWSQRLKEYAIYDKVQVTAQTNGVLLFLRKIPFVGKLIPESIYGSDDLKQVVLVFVFILRLLLGIGWKFAYVFGAFGLQLYFWLLFGEDNPLAFDLWQSLLIWVLLMNVIGFLSAWFPSMDVPVWKFLEAFRLPRQQFVPAKFLIDTVKQALFYVPVAILAGFMASSPLLAIAIPVAYAAIRIFWQWLGKMTWQLIPKSRTWVGIVLALLLLTGSGLIFWFFGSWGRFLFTLPSFLGWVCLAAYFTFQLLSVKDEAAYVQHIWEKTTLALDKISNGRVEKEHKTSMVKKMEMGTSEKAEHLKGNAYLDALLFQRYGTMLRKALWARLGLILAPGIFLIGFAFFFNGEPMMLEDFNQEDWDGVLALLMFVMYFVSFGKNVVQIAFANCDFAMLRYPFYRDGSSIVASFRYRFLKVLGYNLILAGTLFSVVATASIGLSGHFNGSFFGTVGLSLLVFTFLFSFHDLFLYYMIQPFSEDMQVKSPLYQFIRAAFYVVIINNTLVQDGINFLLGGLFEITLVWVLLAISVVYVLVGFPIVYKWAPKTFRLK